MTAEPFATLPDLESRHPAELITLAADEQTGVRDDERVNRALADASAEMRIILKSRYTNDDLARLDADSLESLKVFCIDITLYRIALAFSRSNERIEERYNAAIKRLEAIAVGKGGLSFEGGSGDTGNEADGGATISPNEVIMDAPDRLFTRDRLRGMG